MSQRKGGHMARPRGRQSSAGRGKTSRSSDSKTSDMSKFGQWFVKFLTGPTGQQIFALMLIGFGLLTFFTVAGLNSGAWVSAWARFLVFLLGWGAYPTSVLLIALGLLWLRHLVHQPTAWRWRPFLGLELTLVGLLTLTHRFISQEGWSLVESGRGGGLIGWALYVFFSDYFGPLVTAFIMFLVVLLGLGLAFDLTGAHLKGFGQRLNQVWTTLRAQRIKAPTAQKKTAEAPSNVAISSPSQRRTRREAVAEAPLPVEEPKRRRPSRTIRQKHRDVETKARRAARKDDLPPLTLLKDVKSGGMDPQEIKQKSRIIESTLAQFGLDNTKVTEVRPGPVVTQFGVEPGYIPRGPGGKDLRKVRVSQIAALADDLALALAARSLRVEAPVPGRSVVGIEVPNAEISLVSLHTVLQSEAFQKCAKPLCFAIGLDVAGGAVVADLAAMPHLLIAGTTGSGKSVFVKSLAASLVMYNSPEELRLITIDPKIVELTHLNGLPHLLGRTETDLEQIIRVLRWVTYEMDRRYKVFASTYARNLDDYNAKMVKQGEEPLARIVILIDELADLMMAEPEETERTITRVAQMARATGIHLVVATQRPSTDVVTGLIKANFPARISFATASNVDSRVIIDAPGAESLLGRGDMLFLPPDASAPLRVQGCFVSEDEIESIVMHWQKIAGATPSQAPWQEMAESKGPNMLRIEGQSEDADLLERAIALAKKSGRISTSGLQRRLRISYPRAARLMEQMEKMGLVGPQVSAGRKRRVILGGEED